MPDITFKFSVNASPVKVFDALTDQNRVGKWWTPDCIMDQRAGGHATLEFKGADGRLDAYTLMRIEKMVPCLAVESKCIEQDYQGNNDWIGTTIRFCLSDNGQGGTNIDFAHLDWKSTEGTFRRCSDGWNHVLHSSFKNYLETGKGEPYLAHLKKEAAQKAS